MKRYLVFAGETYYASGGAKDFQTSFEKESEARLYAEQLVKDGEKTGLNDWAHVFDLQEERIILEIG